LWRSDDPGLNGGGSISETAIVDTDGDGIPELLWSTTFTGYADYRLLSFALGFATPTEVVFPLPTTSTGLLPAVAGSYLGAPGGFLVEQGQYITLLETTDRLATGAVCSADETRCMRLDGQYPQVHSAYTYGDRMSFDADGDGDSEYLSASSNDLGAVDLSMIDPSRGLTTPLGLAWQYRYGNGGGTPLERYVYAPEGQGFASSAGGRAVVATVHDDLDTETTNDGTPADDCVNAPDQDAVIAFDAPTGTPLASLVGTRAWGVLDGDADGIPEVLTANDDSGEVAGWELVCTGTGTTGAWSSCDDTGCTLEQAWAVEGTLPRMLPQQIPADSWHYVEDSAPAMVDLDGDTIPEILTESDGDLVAWHIQPDGSAAEVGRHTLGTCSTVGGWTGEGADTWILLEGNGCHTVLDASLATLTDAALVDHTQGVGLALVGDVGRDVPVLTIASRIYTDPSAPAAMDTPQETLSDVPMRFADLDGDGVDELITYAQGAAGDWRIVLYGWTGAAFTERWRTNSTTLGGTDRNISATYAPYQSAIGDYNGDGQLDIAFFTIDPTRGASSFPQRATLFFIDGGTGQIIGKQTAPQDGLSATFAEPMQAADLCAGTTCPGTDGIDEVVLIAADGVGIYGATSGYRYGWSIDTTSEAMWGDFDGDGEPELGLGAGFTSTGLYRVQVVELDGTVDWEATPGSASGSPYSMHAAADVDEDGALDLVVGGGYGEITVYSGVDGTVLPGFPVYLDSGVASTERGTYMRRVLQLVMADIDGDGHVEALVGHDDGTLYAVNLSPAEGTPSLAWSAYLGSPVNSVRVLDADGDGTLEVLVLANDGTARLLDGGDTVVSIDTPIDGACSSDESLVLSGTAEGVDQVEVFLQGISQGRVPVTDGAWTLTLPWPSEGSFRVEVWAVLDDELVASDTITVTFYDDADGDGVSECDSDCDDANADRYPGAEEICDGVDSDCDGTVSDEADDDGDGYLACEECDDADATALPGGVEVCDDLDNDCDGDVDEDDVCDQTSYFRGGGGCGCASTTGDSPAAGIALAALALGLARRRRARS
jgi:MYXO-CTERM domain-containing protein